MNDWNWIDESVLLALHDESLAEHGGIAGIRDVGLFESALARPQQKAHYEDVNVAQLAASYGFGLSKNHAFLDGNKRAAFLSIGLFLVINGYRLNTTQADATAKMLALAAGELSEIQLADWIEQVMTER